VRFLRRNFLLERKHFKKPYFLIPFCPHMRKSEGFLGFMNREESVEDRLGSEQAGMALRGRR